MSPVYGTEALREIVNSLDFPIMKSELIKQVGNKTFQTRENGPTETVSDALQPCEYEEFFTVAAITACPDVEDQINKAA